MQRCSSSNMAGPCSCGMFHPGGSHHHHQPNSFSMLFSMPYGEEVCPYTSSNSVDCTLSLGTPSTRLTDYEKPQHDQRRPSNWSSSFCWDILQSSNNKHSAAPPSHKANRGGNSSGGGVTADPLLARRCANCDTTSTPLWRNGPRGPKSLCNACGIRFKKEERRANAAAAVSNGGGDGMESQYHHNQSMMMNGNNWVHHTQATHKMPSCYSPAAIGNEFRFIDDVDDRDSPFLSWRLNVTDRPGLVHDFTR